MSADGMVHQNWWPRAAGPAWLRTARATGNPLLRTPTRLEKRLARIKIVLLMVAAAGLVAASMTVYGSGAAAERGTADRRPVRATVMGQVMNMPGGTSPSMTLLQVTYRFQGMTHRSTLPVFSAPATGTGIDAWVSRDGRLVSKPHSRRETIVQTALVAVGGLIALAGLALIGRVLLVVWSMRLRAAEWDADWLQFDTSDRPPR